MTCGSRPTATLGGLRRRSRTAVRLLTLLCWSSIPLASTPSFAQETAADDDAKATVEPKSLAGLEIGKKASRQNAGRVENATDFGLTGSRTVGLNPKREITGIWFSVECRDRPGFDDPCGWEIEQARVALRREYGDALVSTQDGLRVEGPATVLSLQQGSEEGAMFLTAHLATLDPTAVCGEKDGFEPFFRDFLAALKAGARSDVAKMFRFPFRDDYALVYHPESSLSRRNRTEFIKKFDAMFPSKQVDRLLAARPACDAPSQHYSVEFGDASVVAERKRGKWAFTGIPYQP
jgi:hypothetical protein